MTHRHHGIADDSIDRPPLDAGLATIEEIYASVGDVERWNEMLVRLSSRLTPELKHHLEIAGQVHERERALADEIQALSTVHAQLAIGAFVVDECATVFFANVLATRLLADGTGLCLVDHRVQATDPRENEALVAAIGAPSAGGKRTAPFVLIARPCRAPLTVFVLRTSPVPREFLEEERRVLLLAFDPEAVQLPSVEVLRALFGFTAREAECAAHLMRGRTIAEAARLMGIGRNTARTFVARMTAKTDSHGQAEFVARLLAIPTVSEAS
jgi:DNA-binding CsgD family transcriptional regulator